MGGFEMNKPVETTQPQPEKLSGSAEQAVADAQAQAEDLLGGGLSACDAVRGCNKEIVQSAWEQESRQATDAIGKNPKLAAAFAKLLQEHVMTADPSYFRITNEPWADFNNAMTRLSVDRSETVAKQVWSGVLQLAQSKDKQTYTKLKTIVGTI